MRSFRAYVILHGLAAALPLAALLLAVLAAPHTGPSQRRPFAEGLKISVPCGRSVAGVFRVQGAETVPPICQIAAAPRCGSVALAEDGSGAFIYTSYDSIPGTDVFYYTALIPGGGIAGPARVNVRMLKEQTADRPMGSARGR